MRQRLFVGDVALAVFVCRMVVLAHIALWVLAVTLLAARYTLLLRGKKGRQIRKWLSRS